MSSPIHMPEDLDPALRYAPRWARDRVSLTGRPLPPPRRARPEFTGDRAMLDLQRQLLLDPDAIPEPPVDDARTLKPIVLRLSGVMALAALIAWGVVSLPNLKKVAEIVPLDIRAPALTGDPATAALPPLADSEFQSGGRQFAAAANTTPPAAQPDAAIAAPPSPAAPSGTQVASLAPVPAMVSPANASVPPAAMPAPADRAAAPADPSVTPAATPAPAEVAKPPAADDPEVLAMVQRGKALMTSGDIASARLLLRRAADAGNAEAALALGATFDPLIIRQLGVIGMTPDPAQAKHWYRRAADLGSASAPGQLAKLEQAQ